METNTVRVRYYDGAQAIVAGWVQVGTKKRYALSRYEMSGAGWMHGCAWTSVEDRCNATREATDGALDRFIEARHYE